MEQSNRGVHAVDNKMRKNPVQEVVIEVVKSSKVTFYAPI